MIYRTVKKYRSFEMKFITQVGLLLCFCAFGTCYSPFKNRGNNGINMGLMMNTANPNPDIGVSGIHSQSPTYLFGDKHHLFHHPHHYHHHGHGHSGHSGHSGHTSPHITNHKRQNRNPFDVIYEWRQLDFEYPSFLDRQRAILNGDFIPSNNLPLGVDRWRNRLFVTMPRWKNGVPASLATLPLPALERSPTMRPYPSWDWHANPEALQPDCSRLMSVYRIWIDECERLWVLDAGIVNATIRINQVCPPKIIVFDLRTDQPIFSYELPSDQVKEESLHSNLIVDIRNGRCQDAHAYITDVWRFGLVVFSLAKGRSWRTTNHFYLPNPSACDYSLNGINFQWTDGVFGISLSPVNELQDRLLFFHPMSSFSVILLSK